jgi:hypothetical protein
MEREAAEWSAKASAFAEATADSPKPWRRRSAERSTALGRVVTDVLGRNHEDDVLGDVRGVVSDALEVP